MDHEVPPGKPVVIKKRKSDGSTDLPQLQKQTRLMQPGQRSMLAGCGMPSDFGWGSAPEVPSPVQGAETGTDPGAQRAETGTVPGAYGAETGTVPGAHGAGPATGPGALGAYGTVPGAHGPRTGTDPEAQRAETGTDSGAYGGGALFSGPGTVPGPSVAGLVDAPAPARAVPFHLDSFLDKLGASAKARSHIFNIRTSPSLVSGFVAHG